jgi:hypothetical protein
MAFGDASGGSPRRGIARRPESALKTTRWSASPDTGQAYRALGA